MMEKQISDLFVDYEARKKQESQDALDAQAAEDARGREGWVCLSETVTPAFQRLASELEAAGHSATVIAPVESADTPSVRLEFRFGKVPPYTESSLVVTSLGGSAMDVRHTLRGPHGERDLAVSAELRGGVQCDKIDEAWLKRLGMAFVEAVLKTH
jgi:hypothetical protein